MTEIKTDLTDEEKEIIISKHQNGNKTVSLLGFAAKAGKVCFGTDKICDEIRRHGSPGNVAKKNPCGIVLTASDISPNAMKRLKNACDYYGARCDGINLSSETLGSKLGRAGTAVAVAVFDTSFKNALIRQLDKEIY